MMPADRDLKRPPVPRPVMDEVNDASFDSFPASDPPPWIAMHIGPPRTSESLPPGSPVGNAVSP
jgi:hypothetical protein